MTKKSGLTAENKILKARIKINNSPSNGGTPFFSYLLFRLQDVEANWMPTFATDGEKIYWNREFVDSLTAEEVAFVICHEILHLVLQHFGRRGGRDRDKWGIAIDHELNLALIDHKAHAKNLHPPKMILADTQYQNMTAEQIYAKIPENCKDKPLDFHLDLTAADKDRMGKNKGMQIPALADPNSPAMIARWQQRLQEAAERASRERGHLPGNVAEIVDALKNPVIPWQRFLQDWICTVLSRDDFDWRYFNPMYIDEHNMYLPACRNETIGAIVIIVDTSGSMSSEQLSQCMSEFLNIRMTYGIEELHLIQCDAQVHSHKIYSQHDVIDPKKVEISGRGGTDLTEAFKFIKENNIQPEFCCVMTDGYTPWPERTPFPVLAALTQQNSDAPDWMDKFVLNV